jgi:hypothetical protein
VKSWSASGKLTTLTLMQGSSALIAKVKECNQVIQQVVDYLQEQTNLFHLDG